MLRTITFVALLALSGYASADGFRYDFLQLDLGTGDFTNSSIDCNVWELNGSLGITERLHIVGSDQSADSDYVADAIE